MSAKQPFPEDVKQRTEYIVGLAALTADVRVLDEGTGIAVLIPDIKHYGVRHIVGCDLSPEMLAEAKERYPDVSFWCGDVINSLRTLGHSMWYFSTRCSAPRRADAQGGLVKYYGRISPED